MKSLHIIITIIFTFGIFMFVKSSSAQQVAINMKPAITKITTKPGKTISQTISIINSGDPQVYTLRVYTLQPTDTLGNYKVSTEKSPKIQVVVTAPYIRLNKPFLMQSGEKQSLPVRIEIPESSDTTSVDGEYIYSVVAESEKSLPVEGNVNTRISAGLGSIFFIRVLSENKDVKNIQTTQFQAVTQVSIPWGKSHIALIDSNRPIPFILLLKNKGLFSVIPQGSLTIKDVVSKKTETLSFLPVTMYPEQDRLIPIAGYSLDQCQKLFGDSHCSSSYSYVHSGYVFGLFEASTKIGFGSDSPVLYSSDFFIVLPFIIVWIVLIGMIGITVLLILWWKKHLQQAKTHHNHKSSILQ